MDKPTEVTLADGWIAHDGGPCPVDKSDADLLRADLVKLAAEEIVAHCEGCGAGLLSSDDYVSGDDCSGCWAAMSDLPSKRERPCYAYRVGKLDARVAITKATGHG